MVGRVLVLHPLGPRLPAQRPGVHPLRLQRVCGLLGRPLRRRKDRLRGGPRRGSGHQGPHSEDPGTPCDRPDGDADLYSRHGGDGAFENGHRSCGLDRQQDHMRGRMRSQHPQHQAAPGKRLGRQGLRPRRGHRNRRLVLRMRGATRGTARERGHVSGGNRRSRNRAQSSRSRAAGAR